MNHVMLDIRISNFLDQDGNGWDIEALESVFWEDDVTQVLRILVGCMDRQDVRRWYFTNNGYYSVKSAYQVARKLKQQDCSYATSSSVSTPKNWTLIWNIQTPNKLKVFMWRLMRNGLRCP